MKPHLILAATAIAAAVISCNSPQEQHTGTGIPPEITTHCPNVLALNPSGKIHIGVVQIEDSILIAQAFDIATRQQRQLTVFNLETKKGYGFFPWPDPDGSMYFGVAPARGGLLYFNNPDYLRHIDLRSKKEDSIPLPKNTDPMIDMIVIQDKVYSLGNSYGFGIIDLKNPQHHLTKLGKQPGTVIGTNNISIPVDPALNLVAACNTDTGKFTVYAIDSAMNLRWTHTFAVKDPLLTIKAIRVADGFLLKYDNLLELLAQNDGTVKWRQECKYQIRDIQPINPNDFLLFLAEHGSADIIGGTPLGNRTIEKWSVPDKKLLWKIDSIGSGGDYAFIKSNFLYDIHDLSHWMMIDLATGKQTLFPFDPGTKSISILHNKTSGENYMLYADSLYW